MKLTDEQIAKLKAVELEMLKEFISVCDKLQLRYYLVGGTLLGAVRHQGFIPWDDDIDVAMPREDYEFFVQKGVQMLPEHLFLQNVDSDPEYLMSFSKIRNSKTTFVETSVHHFKINHGVFIDIFPFDYCSANKKKQKKLLAKKFLYDLRMACECHLPKVNPIKRLLACAVLKTLFPSARKLAQKREKLLKNAEKSEFYISFGGAWKEKEITPVSWYGEGVPVLFEGLEVNAPTEYKQVLTHYYGDYMQLPPVEKRVGHHYVDAIDFDKSYTEYIENQ